MNAGEREDLWFPIGGGRDGEPTTEKPAAGRWCQKQRRRTSSLHTRASKRKGERERWCRVVSCRRLFGRPTGGRRPTNGWHRGR